MMIKDNEKVDDGSIPESVINQLNEHTVGGFVLFYFNSKNGSPEQVMTFDSPAYCLGLQKRIADWSAALQDLNIEEERMSFISSSKGDQEEEEQV